MRHILHFRDNFDPPLTDGLATDNQAVSAVDGVQMHEDDSHVRNLCFVWLDGRKVFFNYAYLIEAEFEPATEKNIIQLNFSSSQVTVQGYGLEPLFLALLDHLPRFITAVDDRYALKGKDYPEIIEITLKDKENTH